VLVIGEKGLDNGVVEYRRRGGDNDEIPLDDVEAFALKLAG
jgi:hypothetical protein